MHLLTDKFHPKISGAYPVPDSMKNEYGTNPDWVETTNDDKANQLPDEE